MEQKSSNALMMFQEELHTPPRNYDYYKTGMRAICKDECLKLEDEEDEHQEKALTKKTHRKA